jgi:hypothetical protein
MKSNRKSTRQSDRLTYFVSAEKRQANRQSKRESGFSVTEGYSRPTDQPAKQIIEQTFCLVRWQSRLTEHRQSGFFSIDEDNHYRVLNSTEAGTVPVSLISERLAWQVIVGWNSWSLRRSEKCQQAYLFE